MLVVVQTCVIWTKESINKVSLYMQEEVAELERSSTKHAFGVLDRSVYVCPWNP